MENKIKELQDNSAKLEGNLHAVTQSKDQAVGQISQLNSKVFFFLKEKKIPISFFPFPPTHHSLFFSP